MTRTIAIAIALMATQASAQQDMTCGPREAVIDRLATLYGESRQSVGLGERGMMVETWASEDTRTWTITVTTPNMMTCFIASGEAYEELAEVSVPQGKEGNRIMRLKGNKS